MRLALVGASLALVAGLTAACGGDDAPDNASKDEFCDAWKKAAESVMTSEQDFDKMKGAYEDAFEVGTPEGISEDAKEGSKLMEDLLDEADSQEDLEKMEEPSEEDSKKVDEFTSYITEECGSMEPESEAPAE